MTERNLSIKYKDSKVYRIITSIPDLTGYTVKMMIKGIAPDDLSVEIIGDNDEVDTQYSVIRLTTLISTTLPVGKYKYALKLIDTEGDVSTIMGGKFTVEDEV